MDLKLAGSGTLTEKPVASIANFWLDGWLAVQFLDVHVCSPSSNAILQFGRKVISKPDHPGELLGLLRWKKETRAQDACNPLSEALSKGSSDSSTIHHTPPPPRAISFTISEESL